MIGNPNNNRKWRKTQYEATAPTENNEEVYSPINGQIITVRTDSVEILNSDTNCKFKVNISNINPNVKEKDFVDTTDVIGKAKGEITLKIKKGYMSSTENVIPYFDGTACEKKEKKKTTEDNSGGSSSKPARNSSVDDLVYGRAAFPFAALQGGISAARTVLGMTESEEERTNLFEDINRIKQLMK